MENIINYKSRLLLKKMYFNKLNRIIKPLEALEFKMQKNYKNGLFVLKYSQA